MITKNYQSHANFYIRDGGVDTISMQTFESTKSLQTLIKEGNEPYYRQGDVWLTRVNSVEELKDEHKFVATDSKIVQNGELTGHFHGLDVNGSAQTQIFANIEDNDDKYVAVMGKEGAMLRHQEHDDFIVEEGLYKLTIEREYDPTTEIVRKVYD